MSKIKVTPEELKNKAVMMKSKIASMKESLNNINLKIDKTENSFSGGAADTLRNQYNGLKSKFDNFYSAMESYANFLENTANSYEETDSTIQKAAEEALNS